MNPYLALVNQKRYFADLLLQQAALAAGNRPLQQALLQGAVLHLDDGLRCYLAEIAAAYQCRTPDAVADPQGLMAALQAQGKCPGEAAEIDNLARDQHTWLGQLRSCRQALCRPSQQGAQQPRGGDHIAALSTDASYDWSLLAVEQVRAWLAACNEMVERQREVMVEF